METPSDDEKLAAAFFETHLGNSEDISDSDTPDNKADQILEQLELDEKHKVEVKENKFKLVIPLAGYHYTDKKYTDLRMVKLMMFLNILAKYPDFLKRPRSQKYRLVEDIEKHCRNYAIDAMNDRGLTPTWENGVFCNTYHSICAKIASNLDPDGIVQSTTLAEKLLAGALSISSLPKLKAQEICPRKYVEIAKKIESSKQASQSRKKTTTMYRCGKCKKNECTYEYVMFRSLDEGIPIRVTCENCGHSWNG